MRAHPLHWLAVLALAGCATGNSSYEMSRQEEFRREFTSGTLCTATDCTVKVTVAANCAISVDPPTLGIDTRVDDATIHWIIQPGASGRVAFTREGINPKAGNWQREFKDPKRVSATEFTWLDKNKLQGGPRKRPHAYNVDVMQDATPCHFDPTIINDY